MRVVSGLILDPSTAGASRRRRWGKIFFYEPSASRSAARRDRVPIRRLEWLCAEMLWSGTAGWVGSGPRWVKMCRIAGWAVRGGHDVGQLGSGT